MAMAFGPGFPACADAVTATEPVTSLTFAANGYDPVAAVRALADWEGLRQIEHLDLSDNGFDDEAIAELLASPHLGRLREMNLDRNRIGNAGAAMLAGSPALASLQRLTLEGNAIGGRGASALERSPQLRRLRVLLLGDDPIPGDWEEGLWQPG
jgi:hypothetical protein